VKVTIDTERRELVIDEAGSKQVVSLYSAESFKLLSHLWTVVGWDQKYPYGFTWMGRPLIQLPEDVIRMQETIYRVRPDVVIETGVAHGGSLILYASLLKAMGRGRVVGVDVEIRPANRKAIESHELGSMIQLIEGSSTAPSIVEQVCAAVREGERVLVILDSNHTKAHVADELKAYASLVSVGSYIVATDGLMESLADVPRGDPTWGKDNPAAASREFAAAHPEFLLEEPPFLFDETSSRVQTTHWPAAYLKRVAL
jgi:cephalosporin hydroxylase